MTLPRIEFPGGRPFAFTIIDDTDVATVENVEPVYRLLERLGMRTTKTVWSSSCPEGSRKFGGSQTLEDPRYVEFVLDLQSRGFEIAWHCATMESSRRDRTADGLARFREVFGAYPRVHANHAFNRENVYWGEDRIDNPALKTLYRLANGLASDHYLGHVEGSPFWWGDLCHRHIEYVRNLTFREINLLRVNPSMPYHDPTKPLVRRWFSASDADNSHEFARLIRPEAQDRLAREGGVCIVATHLGKQFVNDGELHDPTRRLLERLAALGGWFPTVGELLDWLKERRETDELPRSEWRRMQLQWGRNLVVQHALRRARRYARKHRR